MNEELKEELREKSVEELEEIVEELDEKIVDRRPVSATMLERCRKKAVANSVLEEKAGSSTESASSSKPDGQQGLGAFG